MRKKLQRGEVRLSESRHPCAFASTGTFCTSERDDSGSVLLVVVPFEVMCVREERNIE
jgi:hypothetical protein